MTESGDVTRLLLVDDEAATLRPVLAQGLEPLGFSVIAEAEPGEALPAIERHRPDALLLDLHFPGDGRTGGTTTGGRLLTDIRRQTRLVPVLVFTTRLDDVDIPLETFGERPHGFFAKPDFRRGGWATQLARAIRDAIAAARHASTPDTGDLGFPVGQTKEMREAAAAVRTAAANRLTILIYGEEGTGRKQAAEAIHRLSDRTGRFEHYSCWRVSDETADVALFGRESGEHSGAGATPGLVELTEGGTLFLNEIQDLPLFLQHKLLTAVESGKVRLAGNASDRAADVRLIVATNHCLADLVAEGVLRADFAYLLAEGLPVSLPPLRERMADLPTLFAGIVERANERTEKRVCTLLRPETRAKLVAHDWPGNIRELESTLSRAVADTNSNVLLPDDISFVSMADPGPANSGSGHGPATPLRPARAGAHSGTARKDASVAAVTDYLESLPVAARYQYLKSQGDSLRREVLVEFIRRLRNAEGRRIPHKVLAQQLDPLESEVERGLNRIRQFLHSSGVHLTQLDFNQ